MGKQEPLQPNWPHSGAGPMATKCGKMSVVSERWCRQDHAKKWSSNSDWKCSAYPKARYDFTESSVQYYRLELICSHIAPHLVSKKNIYVENSAPRRTRKRVPGRPVRMVGKVNIGPSSVSGRWMDGRSMSYDVDYTRDWVRHFDWLIDWLIEISAVSRMSSRVG